jgi:hypothetical protein
VTGYSVRRWFKRFWLSAWPLLSFLVFASLAVVRSLPGDHARAAVAAPILLAVPGSLTLGAVFSPRSRPQGAVFVCYAALLSAIWTVFASLALYARGVSITAANTYWCLLVVTAVLAIVAETRLWLGREGTGRRAAPKLAAADPDRSEAEALYTETAGRKASGFYGILAVVAGVSLVAGGLYAYDHLPHPAPTGYTWMAWTSPQVKGNVAVDSTGVDLHFQIVHHQPDTTAFRLTAAWLGSPPQLLTKPLTFSIGPDQTFRGTLFVPALPDGCTYRIVMALTATKYIDPLTKKPQTWSIDADVRDPSKSTKTCKS